MTQRVAIYIRVAEAQSELASTLRQSVETRGDTVVAIFGDDARITGRGKHAAWHELMSSLGGVDRMVVASAADLPGRTASDLFKTLATLRDTDVHLHLHAEDIDTGSSGFALLALIAAYRRAKLSQAIRTGQARAVAAGKRIGRPKVPRHVQAAILAALAQGDGVRATARRFSVSPASVVNLRQTMRKPEPPAAIYDEVRHPAMLGMAV